MSSPSHNHARHPRIMPRVMPPRALLPLALLVSLLTSASTLDLTSRCLSSFKPGECPCSRRDTPSLDFCLTSTTSSSCRQRTCADRFICDCSGDTLCRSAPIRTTLTCNSAVRADGTCSCRRAAVRAPAFVTQLIPLRAHRPLQSLAAVFPRNKVFCTERPAFWASERGHNLLTEHWTIAAAPHRDAPISAVSLVRFGHPAHAISFTSPDAVARAMPSAVATLTPVDGDFLDPVNTPAVNHMTAECVAASLSISLASQGIGTRPNDGSAPFDMSGRMVLQPCSFLPKSNPAVGMTLGRLLERAMLATGPFPLDDSTVSHEDVAQACSAINRNFEACNVDAGCVAVTA